MCRPFRAQASLLPITWASARGARFSPGYNIAGLQPFESAYDLSHLGKVFDKVPDEVPDKGQQRLTRQTYTPSEGRRSRVGRFLSFRAHYCANLAHRHSWTLRVAPSH